MEWRKLSLYDIRETIGKMLQNHENGYNSMSDRVYITFSKTGIVFHQICEYPECLNDVYQVEEIELRNKKNNKIK